MSWRQWLAYFEGYLVLSISGDDPEAFLNLALARGISLNDITRKGDTITARMALPAFRELPSLARQSRCRVRIVARAGWPFFRRRLRRRQVLLAGGVFCLLAIYLMSLFVWVVDVKPREGTLSQVTPDQVLAAARAAGLKPGVLKNALDVRSLEDAIEQGLPQLAWVGISFHGTRAEIAVVEKVAPPREEGFDRPASIIATKDGVIKDILVIAGEARVKAGDTVREGEILISGLIMPLPPDNNTGANATPPPEASTPRLVRARGVVRARVWYEGEKSINRRQVQEIPTGRRRTAVAMRSSGKQYIIRGPAGPPFTHYRQENRVISLPSWRNFTLPVELIITTYVEVERRERLLTYEEAVTAAGEALLWELEGKLPPGVNVASRKVTPLSPPDAGTVKVRAWLETEEDIGRVIPLQNYGPAGIPPG